MGGGSVGGGSVGGGSVGGGRVLVGFGTGVRVRVGLGVTVAGMRVLVGRAVVVATMRVLVGRGVMVARIGDPMLFLVFVNHAWMSASTLPFPVKFWSRNTSLARFVTR